MPTASTRAATPARQTNPKSIAKETWHEQRFQPHESERAADFPGAVFSPARWPRSPPRRSYPPRPWGRTDRPPPANASPSACWAWATAAAVRSRPCSPCRSTRSWPSPIAAGTARSVPRSKSTASMPSGWAKQTLLRLPDLQRLPRTAGPRRHRRRLGLRPRSLARRGLQPGDRGGQGHLWREADHPLYRPRDQGPRCGAPLRLRVSDRDAAAEPAPVPPGLRTGSERLPGQGPHRRGGRARRDVPIRPSRPAIRPKDSTTTCGAARRRTSPSTRSGANGWRCT